MCQIESVHRFHFTSPYGKLPIDMTEKKKKILEGDWMNYLYVTRHKSSYWLLALITTKPRLELPPLFPDWSAQILMS